MSDLPEPLVPSDVDLRDMDGFMLNAERLLASELWAISTGEEFKAAMGLWCRAWKQLPAASLPNNDRILASFAGVAPSRWKHVREVAMRGFILCSDGRFYHCVLAEDAMRAWEKKKKFRERSAKGNAKRWQTADHGDEPESSRRERKDVEDQLDDHPRDEHRSIEEGVLEGSRTIQQGDQQGVLEPPQGQGQGHKDKNTNLTVGCPKPAKPVRTRPHYPEDFLTWWLSYPTDDNMSKKEAGVVWNRLSEDERALALASIPGFKAFCAKDLSYRPVHAVRYLREHRFVGFAPKTAAPIADPIIDFGRGYTAPESTVVALLRQGKWIQDWGSPPGKPGCRVPQRLWPDQAAAGGP